jgi:ankyrin repeat protein
MFNKHRWTRTFSEAPAPPCVKLSTEVGKIHDLIQSGDTESVERLLRESTDPSNLLKKLDKEGRSPLFLSVDQKATNPQIVKLLLDAGADIHFSRIRRPYNAYDELDDSALELLKSHGVTLPNLAPDIGAFPPEPTVDQAVLTGNLEVVKLFAAHGADFKIPSTLGYNGMVGAVYGNENPREVVEFLIELGVSPNIASSHGETAVGVALNTCQFSILARLIEAGADESPLSWTALHRAVSIGVVEQVREEIAKGPDLMAVTGFGQTALFLAVRRGNGAMVDELLASGTSLETVGGTPYLQAAVAAGNAELVHRLLDAGCPVDEAGFMQVTALGVAATEGSKEIVRILLDRGANPSTGERFDSILSRAKDRDTILMLLEAGADPAELDAAGRRKLLGLGEERQEALLKVTAEQYFAHRYDREGATNPEDMSDPFRLAMIRDGGPAFRARVQFKDEIEFVCGLTQEARPPQVWCFDRFGPSFTLMPDGRTILIGGEHEDYYDPDFCIYNDVTVFHTNGSIQVFGYPRDVFEPTDFHTANLVGDHIWILGGVGYSGQRQEEIPVYRLDTRNYGIERVTTTGDVPTRTFYHRAHVIAGGLVIEGGTQMSYDGEKETNTSNEHRYRLDLESMVWDRLID